MVDFRVSILKAFLAAKNLGAKFCNKFRTINWKWNHQCHARPKKQSTSCAGPSKSSYIIGLEPRHHGWPIHIVPIAYVYELFLCRHEIAEDR